MSRDSGVMAWRARRIVAQVSELLARDVRGELDEDVVEWSSVADAYLWALDLLKAERRAS
jgi:hypothetical protein